MEDNKEMTYTAAVAELESLVAKMQSPDCGVDNLSKYTTRTLELLKFCKTRLQKTDEELKKILEELDA